MFSSSLRMRQELKRQLFVFLQTWAHVIFPLGLAYTLQFLWSVKETFVDWLWSGQQHQLLSQPIFHPQDHPHLTHTVHLIHTSHTHFFRNKKIVDWLRSGQQHQLFSQHIFHLQDHPHLTHTSSTYTYIYTYIYTLHQHFTYMSATPHPHFINTSHPHFNNA